MKTNMNYTDRIIRILGALAIGVMYYANMFSGALAIILLFLAGVLVITSIVGFCPVYTFFALGSVKKSKS